MARHKHLLPGTQVIIHTTLNFQFMQQSLTFTKTYFCNVCWGKLS